MVQKSIWFKPLNTLTQEELKQIFHNDIPETFIKKYGTYSVAKFPDTIINKDNFDPMEAYLCGYIAGLKPTIPENKIIALFGDPACGKSYLIRLVANLKNKTLDEIKTEMKDDELSDEEAKSIKELVDNITIVPKKTTRPPRENEEQSNPEILEGLSKNNVNACDIKYEYSGNLYGFSTGDINQALKYGSVLMIVNNLDAIRELQKIYGKKLIPICIYRVFNQKDWFEFMQEARRSPDEIKGRHSLLENTKKMIINIGILNLEVIPNYTEAKGNKKELLLRLKTIVDKDRTSNTQQR